MERPNSITQKPRSENKALSGKRQCTGEREQVEKAWGQNRNEVVQKTNTLDGGTFPCEKNRERPSSNTSLPCRKAPAPQSAGWTKTSKDSSVEMTQIVSDIARHCKEDFDMQENVKCQGVTPPVEGMTGGIPMSEAIKIPDRAMNTPWAHNYRECVRLLVDDAVGVPCDNLVRRLIKLQEEYMCKADEIEKLNNCVWSCGIAKLREEFKNAMDLHVATLQNSKEEAAKNRQRICDLEAQNKMAYHQKDSLEKTIHTLKKERDALHMAVKGWEEKSEESRGRLEDSKSWIGTMRGVVRSDVASQLLQKADKIFAYLIDPVLPRNESPINGIPRSPAVAPRTRVTRPPLFVHIAINESQMPNKAGDHGVVYCCAYELKDRLQKNEELSSGREVFVVVGPRLEHDVKREDYIVLQIIYLVSRIERSDRELYESFFGVKKLYAINCAIGAPNPSKDRNYIQQFKQLVGDMIGVLYMAKHKDGYSMKETENVETWRKLCQILMD